MANEKTKNELVADEDPTAELEAVTFRQDHPSRDELPRESDDHTHDVADQDDDNARTISKLQYDIEQLRAKWLGLETEITAREELTDRLNAELETARNALARKDKLLKTRDQKIKSLKLEIRERDELHRATTKDLREEVQAARQAVREIPAPLPDIAGAVGGDPDRLARTEAYADLLRRKMQDILALHENIEKDRDWLEEACNSTNQRIYDLSLSLEEVNTARAGLEEQLASINEAHAEEIRMLRFELGEAQDTVVQTEELNTQLASDVINMREFKEELERMLCENDKQSQQRIDELERELERTGRQARELEEKVEARSDAINVLLAELARKSEQMESIGDIGDVISDIDVRISGRFDEPQDGTALSQRREDRVTRVLVGKIGDKLLRFPLFKDRLTIGRAADNDIQLNATYISRRHAVVQTDGETTRIIDWGSKNGVYVNSARVTEHFLKNGDIVSIGRAHFRYDERPKRDN
jgi:methyl-accepting chemotaxis protein